MTLLHILYSSIVPAGLWKIFRGPNSMKRALSYSWKRDSFSYSSVSFPLSPAYQDCILPGPLMEWDRALLIYAGPIYLKQYGFHWKKFQTQWVRPYTLSYLLLLIAEWMHMTSQNRVISHECDLQNLNIQSIFVVELENKEKQFLIVKPLLYYHCSVICYLSTHPQNQQHYHILLSTQSSYVQLYSIVLVHPTPDETWIPVPILSLQWGQNTDDRRSMSRTLSSGNQIMEAQCFPLPMHHSWRNKRKCPSMAEGTLAMVSPIHQHSY